MTVSAGVPLRILHRALHAGLRRWLAAALAWPAWALWKWRDGWRLAAAIPLLMMGFVVLRIVIDTVRDPTSHNLWPLEILMFGTGSIAIMSVLAVMRRLSRKQQ